MTNRDQTTPLWKCARCGEAIGYIGRFWQWLGIPIHRCRHGK